MSYLRISCACLRFGNGELVIVRTTARWPRGPPVDAERKPGAAVSAVKDTVSLKLETSDADTGAGIDPAGVDRAQFRIVTQRKRRRRAVNLIRRV
jgi:hypothetical protein